MKTRQRQLDKWNKGHISLMVRQTDEWTDGETRGQTNRYMGRQHRWMDGQVDWQRDTWTAKQTGRRMHRQTGQTENRQRLTNS